MVVTLLEWAVQWGSVLGLMISAVGIIIGIIPPKQKTEEYARTRRVSWRYWFSVILIIIGTVLQILGNWPRIIENDDSINPVQAVEYR
jgi:hypothetical protein